MAAARREQCRQDRIKILRSLAEDGDLKTTDFYKPLNGKHAGNDLKALVSQGLVKEKRLRTNTRRCVLVRYRISQKGLEFLRTLEGIAA